MRKEHLVVGLLMLAVVGLLTGCGGAEAADAEAATEVPVVDQAADNKVVAEAVIEPDRSGELNFDAAGDVVEVLVEEGDTVSEGDVLAHLETTDLERAVAQAELDPEKRRELYFQAQAKIYEDAPVVPLVHTEVRIAQRKEVDGYVLHPSSLVRLRKAYLGTGAK